jgi:hypothetical protein
VEENRLEKGITTITAYSAQRFRDPSSVGLTLLLPLLGYLVSLAGVVEPTLLGGVRLVLLFVTCHVQCPHGRVTSASERDDRGSS